MKIIFIILTMVILSGCSNDYLATTPWENSMITGAKLELEDANAVESYSFSDDGKSVAATIGEKDGEIAMPGYLSKIESVGRLVIETTRGKRIKVLTLHKYTESEITATSRSHILIYKRTK